MRPNLTGLLITAFWLVMMTLLARDTLMPRRLGVDAEEIPPRHLTAHWRDLREIMVIRRGPQILGATALTLERAPDRSGHSVTQRLQLDLGFGAQVALRAAASLGPELELEQIWAELDTSAIDMAFRGQVVGDDLLVAVEGPHGQRLLRQPLEKPISLLNAVRPSLLEAVELRPGSSYRVPSTDLFGSLAISDFVIEVRDYDIIETLAGQVATYRVEADFGGVGTTLWVDEMGEVVLQRLWGDIFLERVGALQERQVLTDFPGLLDPTEMPAFDLSGAAEAEPWSETEQSLFSITRFLQEATQ
jgi:hypothetical protein